MESTRKFLSLALAIFLFIETIPAWALSSQRVPFTSLERELLIQKYLNDPAIDQKHKDEMNRVLSNPLHLEESEDERYNKAVAIYRDGLRTSRYEGVKTSFDLMKHESTTTGTVGCAQYNQTPALNQKCCEGLELNSAARCDEPVLRDLSVVGCSAQSDCAPGMGCFPQTRDSLYSNLSGSNEDQEVRDDLKILLETQVEDIETFKSAGASCVHPRECKSYSCDAGICTDRMNCRLVAEGEAAPPGVNCGPGMIKNASGVCELTPEAKNGVFLGLLNEATITPVGQCQFQIDEETRQKSIIAMRSLRAMEWFLSTITLNQQEECFDVLVPMRDKIGVTFRETRKNILGNFTDVLNGIEFDFAQVLAAKEEGSQHLTVHGEGISERDLATRQTSGFDTLMLMYRRNLLFQSYETSMLETVKTAQQEVKSLSEMMKEWRTSSSNSPCHGSRYKTKKPLRSWKTKHWTKVKDHWATQYDVTGNAALNADIVKRENVSKVLAILGGHTEKEAIAEFTRPKYYLLDPMMFGGMRNGSFGSRKKLKKKSSFLGLFGGFKDLRTAYYLQGQGSGSYTYMYKQLRLELEKFYKALKTTPEQRGFVYEPELLTTEAKDCLDNPDKPEKCAEFESFLEGVHDEAFAHFLAWGYTRTDSYSNYFENATSYRRRLMAKLEVDMMNISKYYEKVIAKRNDQNSCIEAVMNGLADSGILTSGEGGLNEGGVGRKGKDGSGSVGKSGNGALRPGALGKATRSRFLFNLRESSLSNINKTSIVDALGTAGSSDVGGVGSSDVASLAIRSDAMKKANAIAAAAGVDVSSQEKAVNDTINSLASKSGKTGAASASSGFGGAGSGTKGSFMLGSPGSAGVSGTESGNVNGSGTENGQVGANGVNGEVGLNGGANAGSADGANGGVYGAHDSGYGANGNGSSDPNGKDHLGLTDADKERMLSEYERNKKDYKARDEDGLFNKVSKAYVRNLEKVLTKKKKIEP